MFKHSVRIVLAALVALGCTDQAAGNSERDLPQPAASAQPQPTASGQPQPTTGGQPQPTASGQEVPLPERVPHDAGSGADAEPLEQPGAVDASTGPGEMPEEIVVWPISNLSEPDADEIRSPYGMRYIGHHDFHAGIDISVPIGTPVHAVLDGSVNDVNLESFSFAIEHSKGRITRYLHNSEVWVEDGDSVKAGEVIALSGDTNAVLPHLHFTYIVPREDGSGRGEKRSRNPLELLPHTNEPVVTEVVADGDGWILQVSRRRQRIGRVVLEGGDMVHDANYREIVAIGSPDRDANTHFGIYFNVPHGQGEELTVEIQPDPPESGLTLVLYDFNGDLIPLPPVTQPTEP